LNLQLSVRLPTYFTIQLIYLLFMDPTAFFDTIHGSYCTISEFLHLSTVFSAKSFQFQQNKQIPNGPLNYFFGHP